MDAHLMKAKEAGRSARLTSTPAKAEGGSLNLFFVVAVTAAYIPVLVTDPGLFTRSEGMALLALGMVYTVMGTLGHAYRERSDWQWATSAYFVVQLAMVTIIVYATHAGGVIILVPIPLVAQAAIVLKRWGMAAVCATVIAVFTIVAWLFSGWTAVPQTIVVCFSAIAFVVVLSRVVVREAEARAEVNRLASQLREANRQLGEYAAQSGEAATSEERSRMARELNDSVTETILSLTLTAEVARVLVERHPDRAAAKLERLHELAQGAVTEMRSLVHQFSLDSGAEDGLVLVLQKHIATLESWDNLAVKLRVTGVGDVPREQTEGLFSIAMEALNNVSKHSGVKSARLDLKIEDERVSLAVEDKGAGFDPVEVLREKESIGLAGMRERAAQLGGTLSIRSSPGKGARVRVVVPRIRKAEDVRQG